MEYYLVLKKNDLLKCFSIDCHVFLYPEGTKKRQIHRNTWTERSWDWMVWAPEWRSHSTLKAKCVYYVWLNGEVWLLHRAEGGRLRGSQQESSLCREAVFRQKAVVTHYQPWKWSTGRLGYPFEPDPGKALPPPQGWGIGVLDMAHPKSKTTPSFMTSFAPQDR